MQADQFIRTDHGDGIVGIGLNRAPVNALSVGFLNGFAALLRDLAGDPGARALVLSSPFKVFSAGIDLKEALDFSAGDQIAMADALNTTFLRLYAFAKPVVVAINGPAIAGGLFFVLTSDFRVAGPRARFGLAEIRVGVDFPVAPMELARAALSPDALRRLMLTGQPVDVSEARAMGMVDLVAPDRADSADGADGADGAAVLERAIAAARDMAASPPQTYAAVKHQIRQATIERIEAAMIQGRTGAAKDWFTAETRTAMLRMLGGS